MNWKVGDKVIIARRDKHWADYAMDPLLGLIATVRTVPKEDRGYYYLDIPYPENYPKEKNQNWVFDGTGFDPADEDDVEPFIPKVKEKIVKEKKDLVVGDFVIVNADKMGEHIRIDDYIAVKGKVCKIRKVWLDQNPYHKDNPNPNEYYDGILNVEGMSYGGWIGKDGYEIYEEDDEQKEEEKDVKIPFKVGDKIVCVNSDDRRGITYGNTYLAVGIEGHKVVIINDFAVESRLWTVRFKKATPAIMRDIEAAKAKKAEELRLAKEAKDKAIKDAWEKRVKEAHKKQWMPQRLALQEVAPQHGAVSCYSIVYKNGRVTQNPNPSCHASIGGGRDRETLIDAIAYHVKRKAMDAEMESKYKRYVDYVMNEGPRSSCFIRQGVIAAFKYGVVYNGKKPISEIIGAANMLREGSEFHKNRLPLFCQLQDEGFSGNVCYLLSYCVNTEMDFVGFCNSHKSLSNRLKYEQVFSFFRTGITEITKDHKPYNQSSNGYDQTIANWIADDAESIEHESSLNSFFKKGLNVRVEGEGWEEVQQKVNKEDLYAFATVLETLVNDF